MSAKQRIFIVSAVFAVICLLVLKYRPFKTNGYSERPLPSGIATSNESQNSEKPADSLAQQGKAPALTHPLEQSRPDTKGAFKNINHNPIEFYGRAVDQEGAPVSGAKVLGSVIYNTGATSGRKVISSTTDTNGLFRFEGLEGQSLGIDLKKEGFEFRSRDTLFWYSYFEADHKRHVPEKDNPVVFVLWKKQGAEPLIHYSKTFWDIPANGAPVRIDLETGKVDVVKGDLVISIVRSPVRMPYGTRGFPWKATVDIVDGGILKTDATNYNNRAPDSGYQTRFEYRQEAKDMSGGHVDNSDSKPWHEDHSGTFFIKSLSKRRTARIDLQISASCREANSQNASMYLMVWLNTSGSDNLEYDPALSINPNSK